QEGITPATFRDRILNNLVSQTNHIFEYFGWSAVALIFFVSLLHRFKRSETSALRWLILIMWIGAVLGMTAFGLSEDQTFNANQLHLLFIPIMTCYGVAYLLVQWNRLEIRLGLARAAF